MKKHICFKTIHRALGAVLILIGLLIFGITTYSWLSQSLLYRYDQPMLERFESYRQTSAPNWLLRVINVIDKTGNVGTAIVSIALGIYWIWMDRWRRLTMLIVTVVGGLVLFMALAFLLDRSRPIPEVLLGSIRLPSYPSGHVIAVMALLGVLLYLYLPELDSKVWTVIVFIAAVLLLLVVSFLRVFEGAHYFTDVIAGLGVGLAWTTFTLMAVDWYFCRKI